MCDLEETGTQRFTAVFRSVPLFLVGQTFTNFLGNKGNSEPIGLKVFETLFNDIEVKLLLAKIT